MTDLETFHLPKMVAGSPSDKELAGEMIQAWRRDGIFQVAVEGNNSIEKAFAASRRFFKLPFETKSRCVSDLTYSGYIASGEEQTAGEADYSEIFTVCPDIAAYDRRVQERWPCHGPAPWPDAEYQNTMTKYMREVGSLGDKLLQLISLGLGLETDCLGELARDGWHHMRVLRFPAISQHATRGIGSHTDYGMLVIAAQDDVGGLFIRPPVEGEIRNRNWLASESAAGIYEDEEPWTFVKPVANVWTVFPGDILQFMTDDYLLSTPHKVRLNTRERFALAYFHEPNFNACVRPLWRPDSSEYIHYGTHFTNMFMRCYPQRVTTRRIIEEHRLGVLRELESRSHVRANNLSCSHLT